jgi:hypothetical protein
MPVSFKGFKVSMVSMFFEPENNETSETLKE